MIERGVHPVSIPDKPTTQFEITKDLLEGFLYGKRPIQLFDVQSKRKRKWEGVEEESIRKLQSLWCEECCKYIQGECPIHHSSQPKLTYAFGSFPPEVRLCTSSIPEYTYGACAAKHMPRGTWIGPYEGRRVNLNQIPKDKDNTYVWEIYENGRFSHFIDGSDENISSWMRFIRCARQKTEQNMSVIQYEKNIYYYATRDIKVGEEMLVWYHESYYQFWGVPLVLNQELDEKSGPPVPPGILQPVPTEVPQTSSPNQANPYPGKPELLHQYGSQKSFLFPKQTPSSKRQSPPVIPQYPPLSPQLPPKPDPSAISPVTQHPSPGALVYMQVPPTSRPYLPPDASTAYPQLTKGTTPYQPLSKSGIPQPLSAPKSISCPTMPPLSAPYSYPPQPRYPPVPPDTILYQPTSSQYQARPSQPSTMAPQQSFLERQRPVAHSMGPPNVQLAPASQISSKSPQSTAHRVSTSPQRVPATQIPQLLTSESRLVANLSPSGLHASQQAMTESSPVGHLPTNNSPHEVQQPNIQSSRGQRVRAYYETDNYTSRDTDRLLTLTQSDQWGKGEVKENMPLNSEVGDNLIIDPELKNSKLPQTLKTTPLQNLNPSIHNKRPVTSEQEKQHNHVSSTVKTGKDHEISWTCGQCGEMFAQQVTLRMHVCAKAPENPYHCGHCTNTFSTSSELREHVITHSNERPFKCGFCGRSFAGATTLGNHMRTHTGQRPYECKVCGQTFAIATQLSRHLRPPGECGLRQKEVNNYNQSVDIAVEQ